MMLATRYRGAFRLQPGQRPVDAEHEDRHRAWSARMARMITTRAPPRSMVPAFVRDLRVRRLPADVVAQGQRCLLDLIGVAAAGAGQRARHRSACVATHYSAATATRVFLFDGRRAGLAGGGFRRCRDDRRTRRARRPCVDQRPCRRRDPADAARDDRRAHSGEPAAAVDGRESITSWCSARIATRAGLALHASVADYHCSGAWNALGCAAVAARLLVFDGPRTARPWVSPDTSAARPDPACVRVPDDGERRLRLGRARRSRRSAARARWVRARGAHHRARRCARLWDDLGS